MRIVLLIAVLTIEALPQTTGSKLPLRALNIEFGIKDHQQTVWDGSASISSGQIVELRGWRFTEAAKLGPGNAWTASTTTWLGVEGGMHPNELPDSYATRVSTIGITVYYQAPEDAEISIKTKQGDFSFRIADVPQTGPIHVLNTRVEIVRVPPVEHLSTPQYEDDYPSIASDGKGNLAVAWIGYRYGGDQIFVRRREAGAWTQAATVTERPGDLYATASAFDSAGRLWIVWSERDGGDWRLKARSMEGGSWGPVETLPSGTGNNLFHRLVAASKGKLHVVYQSARRGRSDIYYMSRNGGSWSARWSLGAMRAAERRRAEIN